MTAIRTMFLSCALIAAATHAAGPHLLSAPGSRAQDSAPQGAIAKHVGAIKAITGNTISLTPDTGSVVNVTVQDNTRILRVAPGQKSLKDATPMTLEELQVGDRILVSGKESGDSKLLAASTILVMKRSDVEARQEHDRQDWQKRGLGGVVSAVDTATGTITVTVTGFGGTKTFSIRTSKDTIIRRYAPDSVKFDDAKPGTLQQVHPGDQLRARGSRSPDGTEITAEEIVSGDFRNVAGTVNAVDASSDTITVQDLLSKKEVKVKVTGESQLHSLPVEFAQRIAARLKGAMTGSSGAASPAAANSGTGMSGDTGVRAGGSSATTASASPGASGTRPGGTPDLQQMLTRMPALAIADLHKGDAVMMVTTRGMDSSAGTVVTLLSGVEPILQAAPNGSQAMILAPWNLGSTSADATSQ
jgi:uncharacterized protein DUF5666